MPSQLSNTELLEQTLNKAIVCHNAGQTSDAERLYQSVLSVAPHHVAANYRLGVLYYQNGKITQAQPHLVEALKVQPHNTNILNLLGVVSQIAGYDKEAISYFQDSLSINPNDIKTLANIGRAYLEQNNFREALNYYLQILRLKPATIDLCIDIGRCLFETEKFEEAAQYFQKALSENPDHAEALCALSVTLWALGHKSEARAKLEHALLVEPKDAKVILNFGEFLAFSEANIDEALLYFNRALELEPRYISAMWRKSFALLARGEYQEGWKLYAHCLGDRETRGLNLFPTMTLWDGKPAPNKRLLIWCEQGLGDSLQFIRYASLCKSRVGSVSIFCQKPLLRLFNNIPFIDYASDTVDRNLYDMHVPIMNLPHLFDTTLDTIPAAPYLHVLPEVEDVWAPKFSDKKNTLKVGLVWAGGAHEDKIIPKLTNLERSITLEHMRPLLNLSGASFYSLQKDKPAEQIRSLGLDSKLINFMDEVKDFADTAAIINNLDLIITVDTSVAHLAGGLGKPVWILSRANADWRWLQNRKENPWYYSARIFGQATMGDWGGVLIEIERELIVEIKKRLA